MFLGFGKGLVLQVTLSNYRERILRSKGSFEIAELTQGRTVTIGRSTSCGLPLNSGFFSDFISSEHGRFFIDNGVLFYEDESKNGSMILKEKREHYLRSSKIEMKKGDSVILKHNFGTTLIIWEIKVKKFDM